MRPSRKVRTSSLFWIGRIRASCFGIIASTLSGEEVAKGRSLFEDKLGEQVAASFVNIVDDPTNPLAYGSVQFDAEGLACRRNSLIDRGTLVGYLSFLSAQAQQDGFHGVGGAGRLQVDPFGRGADGWHSSLAHLIKPGCWSCREKFVQSISGVHSGVNPVSWVTSQSGQSA